jgi:hypothetical protein
MSSIFSFLVKLKDRVEVGYEDLAGVSAIAEMYFTISARQLRQFLTVPLHICLHFMRRTIWFSLILSNFVHVNTYVRGTYRGRGADPCRIIFYIYVIMHISSGTDSNRLKRRTDARSGISRNLCSKLLMLINYFKKVRDDLSHRMLRTTCNYSVTKL